MPSHTQIGILVASIVGNLKGIGLLVSLQQGLCRHVNAYLKWMWYREGIELWQHQKPVVSVITYQNEVSKHKNHKPLSNKSIERKVRLVSVND